jgi:hypothetical protein
MFVEGGFVLELDLLALALIGQIEEVGLGLGIAAELPGEQRDALDEEIFEGVERVEGLAEVVEEAGVVVAFGGGDEGGGVEAGAQAVYEGVLGGAGFAARGSGAGGSEGIGAVGG